MIAGELIVFNNGKDDPEISEAVLIELTDWSDDPFIEIAVSVGKRRVYLKFRVADLMREIKEAQ